MITNQQFDELNKHLELFDLAINHKYIPSGQNGRLLAVEAVHKEYFKIKTDMYCQACVFEMIKRMWHEYQAFENHFKPLEEAKIPLLTNKKHGKR